MAITVYQQPTKYHPVHVPTMLQAGSDNTNNIGFKYKVTIVRPAVADRTIWVSPRPVDSRLELDLSTHLRDYFDYDNFILPTGFNFTRAPYVDYDIVIEEYWDGQLTVVSVEIDGLIATNVLLNRQEWLSFDANKYQIKENGVPPILGEILLNKPSGVPMLKDEYYHIHVVGIPTSAYITILIQQYDAGGSPILPSFTYSGGASTAFASASFAKIDLATMTFDSLTKSISMVLKDGTGNDVSKTAFFDIEDYECTSFERWKLFYMDKLGSYNNISFDLISTSSADIMPKTFRKRIDHTTDNSRRRAITRYTQRKNERYVLNTNYLTEAKAGNLEDLLESPRVFRDVRNIGGWGSGDFLPVEILTGKIERYSYGKNDMPQYSIELRYSHETLTRYE